MGSDWQVLEWLISIAGRLDHLSCSYYKIYNFKKGIGIESQNLCKKFNNQKTIQTRWNSTVAIEQKVDSKAFAIPILTARL